jgi:uncharacterized protein (TIGR02391 family)
MKQPTLTPRDEIKQLLQIFEVTYSDDVRFLASASDHLLKAAAEIRQSWSGSFAGWHGRMYFGDFEKPSIREAFDGEWGGIHGIPDGWQEKDGKQVAAKIDQTIGAGFSVDAFEVRTKAVRRALKELMEDVAIYVSALTIPIGGKATDYVKRIEDFDLGNPAVDFINRNLPTSLWTRDSEAIRQGKTLPGWLYYEACGVEGKKTAESSTEFTSLIQRLFQSLDLAKSANGSERQNGAELLALHSDVYAKCSSLYQSGAYAEAVEKGFKTVRDRLRKLTGYETGSEAFGRGKLHIRGAAAANVDSDFNNGAKFLMMAIDMFRNEKSHTADAHMDDPARAYEYLVVSSLAMHLLDQAEISS